MKIFNTFISLLNYYKKPGLLIILVSILCFSESHAQDSILQHRITLSLNNIKLSDALDSVGQQVNSFVTYNSDLVDGNKKVDVYAQNKPLVQVLQQILLDTNLHFYVIKRQIIISTFYSKQIITENKIEQQPIPQTIALFKIQGQILDKQNNKPLPYATLGIRGKHIGTISNIDGEFLLRIKPTNLLDTLVISYVGYRSYRLLLNNLSEKPVIIKLTREQISLQEVIIRNTNPVSLIRAAVNQLDKNYPQKPINITAFYRESVKKNKNYTLYLEAVLNIYKSTNPNLSDQTKIFKSRKIYDVSKADTVSLRLKGGIESCMLLDIIKNIPDFLKEDKFSLYHYYLVDISIYDDKTVYIIEFKPLENITTPMFHGRLYLDTRSLAIIRAEFGYAPKFAGKMKNQLILKKKRAVKVKPLNINYSVNYRDINEKYYLNHVQGQLKFRIKNRKKLFASTFETSFEAATTKIDTLNVKRFRYREIVKPNTILSKENLTYDPDFWGNQIFIRPEENIKDALKRITSSMQQIIESK